jgi:hypothetical protein
VADAFSDVPGAFGKDEHQVGTHPEPILSFRRSFEFRMIRVGACFPEDYTPVSFAWPGLVSAGGQSDWPVVG